MSGDSHKSGNRGHNTTSTPGGQPDRPSGASGDEDRRSDGGTKMDISPAQVTGGALASVTAAFLGGQLGVAGTVAGAALTSIVITVGGAVYQRSLETTKDRANVAAAKAALRRARRRPLVGRPVEEDGPTRRIQPPTSPGSVGPGAGATGQGATGQGATGEGATGQGATGQGATGQGMHWPGGERVVDGGTPSSPADTERTRRIELEGRTRRLHWDGTRYVPVPPTGGEHERTEVFGAAAPAENASSPTTRRRRRIRWSAVAVTSGLAFLLCMIVVTGFEGITGQPLSGGEKGTTVGHLFRPGVPADGPVQPEPQRGSGESDPAHPGPASTEPSQPSSPQQPSQAPTSQVPAPGGQQQDVPDEQPTQEQQPAPETGGAEPSQQPTTQAPEPGQQAPQNQSPNVEQPLGGQDPSSPQ